MGQRTVDFETAYAKELGEGAVPCGGQWHGGAAYCGAGMRVGPGDEVIVPSLTFIADLNSVQVSGGKVVMAMSIMSDWSGSCGYRGQDHAAHQGGDDCALCGLCLRYGCDCRYLQAAILSSSRLRAREWWHLQGPQAGTLAMSAWSFSPTRIAEAKEAWW